MVRNGLLYHVHGDQLGRPHAVTNGGRAVVWQAYNQAFDRQVTLDTIGGLNIGLPGQYYDAETGYWNNGFRDYDSGIGRYIQSDPIGLAGGLNTYAYVGGNPMSRIDPMGLTQCDIDAAWTFAKQTQGDLNFFGLVQPTTAPPVSGYSSAGTQPRGQVDTYTGTVVMHPDFLKSLDFSGARDLYITTIHEVLHPNYPSWSEGKIQKEARDRGDRQWGSFEKFRQSFCSCKK